MQQWRRNPREASARGARVSGMALVLAALVTGCPGPAPYNGGTYVYDEYGTLEREPACTLTGGLELTLGEGDGTNFIPLAPGQEPVLYYGPQGGTHVILGVAVANPAIDFPGLALELVAEHAVCFSETGTGCPPAQVVGRSEVVVLKPERFLPAEGGAITVSGFLVIVDDWNPSERRRLRVEATDRCGRTGTASVQLGPPQ